jgi:2-keto-4-pentenoate hydratase/2-oxohepta-3-ene-1,7-dioic acid hydratase in catechol pathway
VYACHGIEKLMKIIKDPNNLRITTKVNGELVQDSTTKDMIFNVKKIINFISQGTTLLPGDIIMTGTPQGIEFFNVV